MAPTHDGELYVALALPAKRVAENLNLEVSTINRTLQTFEVTGSVDKKSYNSARLFRKIMETLVIDRSGILLREIREELILTAWNHSNRKSCVHFSAQNWIHLTEAKVLCNSTR
jgi:hypothetical protein